MTDQTTPDYTAKIAERTVVITWPNNDRGGATPPPDGWAERAMNQESTLYEIDEGSISGCSVLRWRDDSRPDAELIAHSLMLVTGKKGLSTRAVPLPPADQTTPLRDRIAEAALTAVEAALGDTLVPAARAEALAGIAAVLPAPADRTAGPAALREAAAFFERTLEQSLDDSDPRYCTAIRDVVLGLRRRADETATSETQAADLPARLEAVLTERYTELGNPFAEMRRQEQGPDGWPASHPVGPHHVAETLRELLTTEARQDGAQP